MSLFLNQNDPERSKRRSGFNIIELMIAMVITLVIMVGIYKYWISNITTTTQTLKLSVLQTNAEVIFNNIRDDLRSVAFNPLGLTGSDGKPKFRIFEDPDRNDFNNLHRLRYSHYTDDPACTGPETAPGICIATCLLTPSQDTDCCCKEFSIQDDGGILNHKVIRKSISIGASAETTLFLNNACIAFIFWDATNNIPCSNQATLSPCTGSTASRTAKLIVAVAPTEKAAEKFDMSGCLDSTTTPCCHISDPDLQSFNLRPSDYVRIEKNIHLRNLIN